MKTKHFLKEIDNERLAAAIQDAERGNSGDVVLFISHKTVENPVQEAHAIFKKLNLEETTPQNSVLIFISPKSQRLSVIGGTDLYKALPPEWWAELVKTITVDFAKGGLNEGLLAGLKEIGKAQRLHFPSEKPIDRAGQQNLLEEN